MKQFKKLTMPIIAVLLLSVLLLPGCTKVEDNTDIGENDSVAENETPVAETNDETETISTQVVVVGSGATGLSASIEARQQGLDVIMLEKNAFTGGTTNTAEGYGGLNSNYAEKQGIHYDVREVFFAAQEFHHWATDQDCMRTREKVQTGWNP